MRKCIVHGPINAPKVKPFAIRKGHSFEIDYYCLGALLYELLTGSTPLQDEDVWQSAYRRVTGDPVAPRKLNAGISPQAEEIVLHAMQRRPEDRYQSMAAFQADLDAPERVRVTGYCDRLRRPRWKLSFHANPILAGALLGLSIVIGFAVFLLVMRLRLAAK